MSCLPWGYANKVVPVFVPASGDSLIVQGNALVKGGFLTVGNDGFQENDRGAFFQMTPSNAVGPITNLPYYYFQANPEDKFLLARINTPPPALTPNSTILRAEPSSTTGDNNRITVNAQVSVQGAIISDSIISGLSGIKYVTGLTLGPFDGVKPSFNYLGATLLIRLPSDFFTNTTYTGSIIFRFIFPQATTGQAMIIYRSNGTELLRFQPNNTTITEGIWNGTNIHIFSYPYIETLVGTSTLSALQPGQLSGNEPIQPLPLGNLPERII